MQWMVALLLVAIAGFADGRPNKAAEWSADEPSCGNKKTASATAVSIVYAVCTGDVVLAADAIATASASGCTDTFAAAVGVSIASLGPTGPDGLQSVISQAFVSSFSGGKAIDGGIATAEALALAIASATPSFMTHADLLSYLAGGILALVPTSGCNVVTKLAQAVVDTLQESAPDMVAQFNDEFSAGMGSQCAQTSKKLKGKKVNKNWARDKRGGEGLGHVKRALFNKGTRKQKETSSLAITVAQVSCPASGDASVAAIAIASAYVNDKTVATNAVAGVLAAGVSIDAVVMRSFTQPLGPDRKNCIQALGATFAVMDPSSQSPFLAVVALALDTIQDQLGCTQVAQDVSDFGFSDPAVKQQLCRLVMTCPGLCLV